MNSIFLKDINKTLYYYNQKTEIKNALGQVSATLTEYIFTATNNETSKIICRLYKTKENSWYDPLEPQEQIDNKLRQEIKSAIDALDIKR